MPMPPRITFYPDKILDVITEVPQPCNSNNNSNSSSSSNAAVHLPTLRESKNPEFQNLLLSLSNFVQPANSSLTLHNNENFSSHFEELRGLLLEAREKDDKMLTLQDNILGIQAKMFELQLEVNRLQLEAKEKDDEMLEMQKKTLNLQQQALDRLAILQKKAEAILVQNFELHEYPIPRLFIILPVDRTKWDPMNILRNKIHLHFLCEHGDYTAKADKSFQDQLHLARHEGYEIRSSTEFFQKYGKYMIILLQWLKLGMGTPSGASLTPVPNLLAAGIAYSIKYMEQLSKENPALKNINTIDDFEVLEGADLRQLSKLLQTKDEDKQFGNLYRITTETGHIRWVCVDHYRSTYRESEQKALENVVEVNGGKYDSHLGK
ncbi:hypothetical protein BX616_002325, partial [Lobosporangium transversale]